MKIVELRGAFAHYWNRMSYHSELDLPHYIDACEILSPRHIIRIDVTVYYATLTSIPHKSPPDYPATPFLKTTCWLDVEVKQDENR